MGYWHEDKFGQRKYVSTEKAGGETPESHGEKWEPGDKEGKLGSIEGLEARARGRMAQGREMAEQLKKAREPKMSQDGKNAEKAQGPVDHEVAHVYHREKAEQLRAAGHTDAASWHSTAAWSHFEAAAKHNQGKTDDVKSQASRSAQELSTHAHTAEAKAVQEGARGGRYYVAATGAKVYVKSNPGAETIGHMSNQRFHQGLPMSVHLSEPRRK